MTKDDIIRMAREAGLHLATDVNWMPIIGLEYAEKFASLVIANNPPQSFMSWQEGYAAGVAAEREACARVCEDEINRAKPIYSVTAENALKAIRARGSKPTSVIYSPGQLAERGLTHEDVVKLIKENT